MKISLCKIMTAMVLCLGATCPAGSDNGSAGNVPAYYDRELFSINFKGMPSAAAADLLVHNPNVNLISMSDDGLPGGEPFISVLDAIQGEGFNPLWLEVQTVFTSPDKARQLFFDDEISAALNSGEINLLPKGELYRCSVVGPKPKSGVRPNVWSACPFLPVRRFGRFFVRTPAPWLGGPEFTRGWPTLGRSPGGAHWRNIISDLGFFEPTTS